MKKKNIAGLWLDAMNAEAVSAANVLEPTMHGFLQAVTIAEQKRMLEDLLPDHGQALRTRAIPVMEILFRQDSEPTAEDSRQLGLVDEVFGDTILSRRKYILRWFNGQQS